MARDATPRDTEVRIETIEDTTVVSEVDTGARIKVKGVDPVALNDWA